MIKGLYETHIDVENLQRSIEFYQHQLGLTLCYQDNERHIAFFWIGKPKEYMLGLWEKPAEKINAQHFAFRCETNDILTKSSDWLLQRGLKPYNFLKDGSNQPMVFAWMPSLAIYFKDPDGHILEFIAVLDGDGKPELGVISYPDWLQASQ